MDINDQAARGGATSCAAHSAAAALAATGSLAACATSGTGTSTSSSSARGRSGQRHQPLRRAVGRSTVDAVIFNGGYGIDYAEFAGKQVEAKQSGCDGQGDTPPPRSPRPCSPASLRGDPPDVIDNSGADLIGINTIRDQLVELNDVIEAKNYEGTVIKDTLYAGRHRSRERSTASSSVLNYALTVYAIWYSASLFEKERLDRSEDVRRDAGPRRARPRPRASICSAGARRRQPTTRRWPSLRRSRGR